MNRNLYRAFILITFIGVNTLVILGVSWVIAYFNSGADRSAMLHLDAYQEAVYSPIIYLNSKKNQGRSVDTGTLKTLGQDYVNAWYSYNQAIKFNDTRLLKAHFTDSAVAKFERSLNRNRLNNLFIKQTTLEHSPQVDFYSEDGRVAVIKDSNLRLQREIYRNDSLLLRYEDTIQLKAVLLLEDGVWKVRHWVQTGENATETSHTSETVSDLRSIRQVRGVNYYPRNKAWQMFGAGFDEMAIRSDMNLIKSMGLNTLRIFMPYEDSGGPEISRPYLDQLRTVLDLAESHQLKVLVTLFDFYGNYDIEDWTRTLKHTNEIVNDLKGHEALLGWDVKNEPDLDFESRGKDRVLAWLKEILAHIKKIDKKHPVTVGWSNMESATELRDEVDFISFHYYGDPEHFSGQYQELLSAVGNKVVLLQEYGMSSYSGLWNGFSGSDKKQANFYESMQKQIKENELPYLFWTLYDMEQVPIKVVGKWPWRRAPQKFYGCLDSDGNPKVSFEFLKQE